MPRSRRLRGPRLMSLLTVLIFALLAPAAIAAQTGTPVASPIAIERKGPLPPAWLGFGPNGQLIARILVAGECPSLTLDGRSVAMTPRTAPNEAFPVVACEATVPFGVETASILDQTLPLPDGPLERIAVIGDTGCRLNDWEKNYQSCNDPDQWPFAEVAASVAAWQPDLIVHVGDYLYRESPCPATGFNCGGSPHGDNWETWNADFFGPASSFLGVAPLVLMRGNHETCDRNAGGWFAYLEPRPIHAACQVFTEPYAVTLEGLSLAVLDSAEASGRTVKPGEVAQYTRQFALLRELAPPGSWLVTHRPVWGIVEGSHAETEFSNESYEAATGGSLEGQHALILSGHVHLAEAIDFDESSGRPPQIISGNSGTALDDTPTASPTAGELGDPEVEEAETLSSFGFLTLVPDGDRWIATQRNAQGDPLLDCVLDLPEMSCAAASSTESG